jgi:DNA-binding CsgD family transcriptional regulator
MPHVHLIPEHDVARLRRYMTLAAGVDLPRHFAGARLVAAPERRAACRCCGYRIPVGESAITCTYRWGPQSTKSGLDQIWLHATDCRWGLAHDVEPPDPARSVERRQAAAYRAKEARRQRAARRREERRAEEAEAAAAKLVPAPLTAVERGILELAEAGATVPETARRLHRAKGAIESTATRLNKRFGTTSRVSAAAVARSLGLLGGTTANVAAPPPRRVDPGTVTDQIEDADRAVRASDASPTTARNDIRELLQRALKLAEAAGVDIDEARRAVTD